MKLVIFIFFTLIFSSALKANDTITCNSNILETEKTYTVTASEIIIKKNGTVTLEKTNKKGKTKSKMTTFILTVLGGITIFSIGQILLKLIIDPVQELKKYLGQVSQLFLSHQATISNRVFDDKISKEIVSLSAKILSQSNVILFYNQTRFLFNLPSMKNILEASKELNFISFGLQEVHKNSDESYQIDATDINKSLRKVSNLLAINTTYE